MFPSQGFHFSALITCFNLILVIVYVFHIKHTKKYCYILNCLTLISTGLSWACDQPMTLSSALTWALALGLPNS